MNLIKQKNWQVLALLLSILPAVGCAEKMDSTNPLPVNAAEPASAPATPQMTKTTDIHTEIGDKGQVLTTTTITNNRNVAEIHAVLPPKDREEMVEMIVWGLEASKADTDFVSAIKGRLLKNRRLDKSSFQLNLTGLNGEKYLVTYDSDFDQKKFSIGIQH